MDDGIETAFIILAERIMDIKEQVKEELEELKKLGVKVPQKAFDYLDKADMEEYICCSVTEIADTVLMIGNM